jgi:hypothetical protein
MFFIMTKTTRLGSIVNYWCTGTFNRQFWNFFHVIPTIMTKPDVLESWGGNAQSAIKRSGFRICGKKEKQKIDFIL